MREAAQLWDLSFICPLAGVVTGRSESMMGLYMLKIQTEPQEKHITFTISNITVDTIQTVVTAVFGTFSNVFNGCNGLHLLHTKERSKIK